jgi:hypothetical protein
MMHATAKLPYASLHHVVCGCFLQFSLDLGFPFLQSLYLTVEREVFDDARFLAERIRTE